jgi:predicted DsbA family dithiol-disulfide isomerase
VERRAYRVKKFGSWERSLDAQVGRAFAGEGLVFNPDGMARTPNTFDAHRIIWLARECGMQDAVVEVLFQAYFTDGRNLSDRATLTAVAVEGGLDAGEVNEFLAGDRGAAEVRRWEQQGQRLGISGVPFFVVNGAVALSGAQSPETFRAAIEQATAASGGDSCDLGPVNGKREC